MSEASDRLLDVALEENFGHGPAPDLPERILDESGIGNRWSEIGSADRRFPISEHRPRSRGLLRFAGLLAAAALIGWAIFAPMERLPAGVTAENAEYTVRQGAIEARSGWYLLSEGAPPLQAGGTRVEGVTGRVLVKAGEIPEGPELAAIKAWLARHNQEAEMKAGDWIKAGAVSLCLLAGSATVDGNEIHAQAMERKRVQELERELEKAREELKEAEEEAKRQAEDGGGASETEGHKIDEGVYVKSINGNRVNNQDDLRNALRGARDAGKEYYEIEVDRYGKTRIIRLRIPQFAKHPAGESRAEMQPGESGEFPPKHASYLESASNELRRQASVKIVRLYELENAAQRGHLEELQRLDEQISECAKRVEEGREALLKDPLNRELAVAYKDAAERADTLGKQRQELAERLLLPGDEADTRQSRYLNNAFNEVRLETLTKLLLQGGVRIGEANRDDNEFNSAAELRRLIAEKERELAELRRDAENNAARAKEVERSIEALRAGLKALERAEESASDTTDYTVQEGDSWWRLANVTFKDRGLSTQDLQQANPGVQLRPGATIRIPDGK